MATPPFVELHDVDLDKIETTRKALVGYQIVSLGIYGDSDNPQFAAVWAKRTVNPHQQIFPGPRLSNIADEIAAAKMSPRLVSATGTPPNIMFAVVAVKTIDATRMEWWLQGGTEGTFKVRNTAAKKAGLLLNSAAGWYGNGTVWYAAIWIPNKSGVRWNYDLIEYPPEGQARCMAFALMRARASLIAPIGAMKEIGIAHPGGHPYTTHQIGPYFPFALTWTDDTIGVSGAQSGISKEVLEATLAANEGSSFYPVRLHAASTPAIAYGESQTTYSVIWATQDQPIKRAWHLRDLAFDLSGPKRDAGPFGWFKNWLKNVMMTDPAQPRAAQLALFYQGRLVCSLAATWAEPGYPLTDHVTLFRFGSLSKPITAMALMRLMEQIPSITFDTPITTALSAEAADPDFMQVHIRHLLLHQSGIGKHYQEKSAKKEGYGPYPIPRWKYEAYMLSRNPYTKKKNWFGSQHYSNRAFLLLGRIIDKHANGPNPSYEKYVREYIFDKVGIPIEKRGVVPDPTKSIDGEALYQGDGPGITKSTFYNDERYVPQIYGAFSMDLRAASGGWAMAAPDYARILAVFDWQKNPLFDNPLSAPKLLAPRTANLAFGMGYQMQGVINQKRIWYKRGELAGTSIAFRREDGFGGVVVFNSNVFISETLRLLYSVIRPIRQRCQRLIFSMFRLSDTICHSHPSGGGGLRRRRAHGFWYYFQRTGTGEGG